MYSMLIVVGGARGSQQFCYGLMHRPLFLVVYFVSLLLLVESSLAILDNVRLEIVPVAIINPAPPTTTSQPPPSTVSTTEEDGSAEDFLKIIPQQQQWIVDYLLRYGYLDFGIIEQQTTTDAAGTPVAAAQRLVDPRAVVAALARFQAFSGLRATGKIDFATRQQLVERRCGVRDVDREFETTTSSSTTTPTPSASGLTNHRLKRYAVSANIRWRQKRLSYQFLNYSANLGPLVSRKLVERALDQWAKAAKLDVVEELALGAPADITFLFARKHHGDAYRFDGNGAVLAHAFFPGEQRGGEVHFDDDEDWFDRDVTDSSKQSGVDLYAVALHEIGHALGLGHSSVADSVMNPWYNNYASDPRLGDDDLHALAFLYGAGSLSNEESSSKTPPIGSKPDLENLPTPGGNKKQEPEERVPDVCDTDFDAISMIRGKIFAFRRNNLWRFEQDGSLSPGFPMLAHDFFMGLPQHIERIDTFYERRADHDVVIFSEGRYWRFRANALIPGFPPNGRPIIELGLPGDVQRIDAAFVWSGNLYTYLVAGDRYWRLDEHRNHVDYTYPRPVERFWRGVPLPVNSAFLNTDGVTYFVVDALESENRDDQIASNRQTRKRFIPFDDYRLEAARSKPLETTKLWTGCLALNTSIEETKQAMPMNKGAQNISPGSLMILASLFSTLIFSTWCSL